MKLSKLNATHYDVIVCGAGSAGTAAAYAAAMAGASTLLIERHGFGGGILTAAMIHTFDAIKSCSNNDHIVAAGFASELLQKIESIDGLATPDNPPEALTVHPEMHKIAIDRLLQEAGVKVLYHANVCDVIVREGKVVGVEAALRDGRARFFGKVTVDATGDADVAYHAGAPFELAPDLQALTYHFRLGNVKGAHTWDEWETICGRAMTAAHAAGDIHIYGGPWFIRLAEGELSVNSTRIYGNPVDPEELTAAEIKGRESMLTIWNILRSRVPELSESYILSGASQLHIRESRKVVGDYVLTEDDIWKNQNFDDAVALGAWPVDIHPTDGFVGVHPHKDNPPEPYEIPYRCLLPKGVENLLVAGKPISTTHRAHGSTRVPGTSLATGQAAGAAAALAARYNITPRKIEISELRDLLKSQGAITSTGEAVHA
ncbi:FAD-dependent oxidoreductase [soil metagenome]